MKVDTITAPACWASALVNGDASGMTPQERAAMALWLIREGYPNIYDVARDGSGEVQEPRFTWHFDLYAPECGVRGGEVLDYVVLSN